MQKSKFLTFSILIIIFVYSILSQLQLKFLGSTYVYIINPLFFVCLALFAKFFIQPPYLTNKHKRNLIEYVLICILVYCLVYLLSGLLVGFGKNPYSSTFRGLVFNIYSVTLIIFCREYIRFKLINNVYNNDKKMFFVFIVIVFSFIDFNFSFLFTRITIYNIFKNIFTTLFPNIFKNILFTYLVMYSDHTASFVYDSIYYLILWLSPILPKSPWVLEAILNSIFPLTLLLYCRYYIMKKDRFQLSNVSEAVNPSGLVPFGIAIVLVIWFALGIFPVQPVSVATRSMVPTLNYGDLTFIKKCTPNDVIVNDIIEYQMEGYTVIHRIKEIYQENGEFFFITKGDNNDSEDKNPVSEDQLIGKVIFKIPYLGLPTVWLYHFNNQTTVEVETGM